MTRDEIELLRTTFAELAPIRAQAARLFYARLFEVAPDVRPMFSEDLAAQGARLMGAVARVIDGLDRPDELRADLAALGRRHAGYGVEPRHYRLAGDTLLWTLETSLGEFFTPAAQRAWTAAFDVMAAAMMEAATAPQPQAA